MQRRTYCHDVAYKPSIVLDVHNIDRMVTSHLGEDYTLIITKNSERITVHMPIQECRARFFRVKWEDAEEE